MNKQDTVEQLRKLATDISDPIIEMEY